MDLPPSAAEKRAAVEKVLQSTTFLRADQLRKFLRFICEMEIDGRSGEICEYIIGVEAFGRPADFSPTEDSVVRRRAIDLRNKLEDVYTAELASATLRIELPKGKYIPHFVEAQSVSKGLQAAAIEPVMRTNDLVMPTRRRMIDAFWLPAVFFTMGVAVTWIACQIFPSLLLFSKAPVAEPGVTYEAEASGNIFGGGAKPEACSPCSGGARVRKIGSNPLNYVMLNNVTVGTSGNRLITVYYLLDGNRSFFVSVNGDPGIQVPLTGNSWSTLAKTSISLPLNAGSNAIKFYNDSIYAPDLDRIVVP